MKILKTYKNYINENVKLYDGLNEKDFFDKYLVGTQLICSENNLTSLPELPSNLTHLYCTNNNLTSLPELSSTNLTHLYCYENKLISLPELSTKLEILYCSSNNLTSLPDLPSTLTKLSCSDNDLPYTDLDGYKIWFCQTYPHKCKARDFNL